MQAATTIAYLLVTFMAVAIFLKLGHHIVRVMTDPPAYYEGRDWFDEPDRLRFDPFEDSIPIEIYDRDEEEFE